MYAFYANKATVAATDPKRAERFLAVVNAERARSSGVIVPTGDEATGVSEGSSESDGHNNPERHFNSVDYFIEPVDLQKVAHHAARRPKRTKRVGDAGMKDAEDAAWAEATRCTISTRERNFLEWRAATHLAYLKVNIEAVEKETEGHDTLDLITAIRASEVRPFVGTEIAAEKKRMSLDDEEDAAAPRALPPPQRIRPRRAQRTGERRVGEECRGRGAP